MKDFRKFEDGTVAWTQEPGDKYVLCGEDRQGKSFRCESTNYSWISMINVWRARLYMEDGKTHKRKLLKTITP